MDTFLVEGGEMDRLLYAVAMVTGVDVHPGLELRFEEN